MTKPTAPKKPAATNRKHYSPEYKANVLKLAERVGVAKAAEELTVPPAQLYNWRKVLIKRPAAASASRSWPTRMPASSACWPRRNSWRTSIW